MFCSCNRNFLIGTNNVNSQNQKNTGPVGLPLELPWPLRIQVLTYFGASVNDTAKHRSISIQLHKLSTRDITVNFTNSKGHNKVFLDKETCLKSPGKHQKLSSANTSKLLKIDRIVKYQLQVLTGWRSAKYMYSFIRNLPNNEFDSWKRLLHTSTHRWIDRWAFYTRHKETLEVQMQSDRLNNTALHTN